MQKDKILFLIYKSNQHNSHILNQLNSDDDFIVGDLEKYFYEIEKDKIKLSFEINNKYIDLENFKNIVLFSIPYYPDIFLEKINQHDINLFNKNFLFSKNVNLILNKVNQHIFFKKNNIPFLKILNDFNIKNIDNYLFKLNYGSLGQGIYKPKDKNNTIYKNLTDKNNSFLEKYIENKKDYRVMLMNKKSLGVVYKENRENNIINFFSGAIFHKFYFPELEKISENICNLLDLDYCAIDFIVDENTNEIYVLEINFFAKYEGFEKIYGDKLILSKFKEYFINQKIH